MAEKLEVSQEAAPAKKLPALDYIDAHTFIIYPQVGLQEPHYGLGLFLIQAWWPGSVIPATREA